ncbi:MAG: type II/IV secretion system ATPase subunit [Candidatus Aenigmarchaeota archaeon]|nr:type II/IV secretion system ATPase subunit [Candidatus Aenigmarchaeota archaeon]
MVKIKIKTRNKKTKIIRVRRRKKPIKILNPREYVFKRKPIIINYIPPRKKESEEGNVEKKESCVERGKFQITNFPSSIKLIPPEKKKYKIEGLPFPHITSEIKPMEKKFQRETLYQIDIKYPLIPKNPSPNEEIYAYAHIFWSKDSSELVYNVVEPEITEKDKEILELVKEYIREKLDIDFESVKKFEARNYLFRKIDEALEYFKFGLSNVVIKIFRYYIYRDFIGFDRIEPLLQDDYIEDISCDGLNTPIYIVHRDPRFGSLKTNIVFETSEELNSFVIKLAQRCGKDISVAHPLLDGILPDNSRVQATLATDIARRGSNFTIRKFSSEPFTPPMQILYNTCDVKLMAYIWFALEYGRSILISGGTGSGKTSLLNSISLLIRPQDKIVSIEDTGELRLPHPNWIPEVARSALTLGGRGSVTLFDLLRESLRQRPDRIIVGEVRGKEAFVLFQSMATGHPGLATIHAESIETLIDRLITEPINLPATLLEMLDIVIFISRVKIEDQTLRRVTSIEEIAAMDYKSKRPIINTFAKWNPKKDEFIIKNKSVVLKNISDRFGMKKEDIYEDIKNKAKILEWLTKNRILNYKNIGKYLAQYNANPGKFLESIDRMEKRNKHI